MKIPVFHDDQHGTAIITTAAVLNGLRVVKKNISDVRPVVSGAGAASIACLNLLVALGLRQQNITVCDSKGVIYKGRDANMEQTKAAYAIEDNGQRTLGDAIPNADIFLGCSGPGVLTQDMVKTMARDPLIMALANPEPEILPPLAKAVRPDAIICTGRPTTRTVNNVLCFPFIFRGALDVGATTINEEMKLACVHAIADLALAEQSDVVASAYDDRDLLRAGIHHSETVRSAPDCQDRAGGGQGGDGVRRGDAPDRRLRRLRREAGGVRLQNQPVHEADLAGAQRGEAGGAGGRRGRARAARHAGAGVAGAGLPDPGRPPERDRDAPEKLGLQLTPGKDFEVVNNESDPRFNEYWGEYYQIMKRRGVSQEQARRAVIGNPTLIAAIMLHRGEADAMICGTIGSYHEHYDVVKNVFGFREGAHVAGAMNALLLPSGNTFIADTYVNDDPTPEQLAEITLMAAETVRRFGIEPKVALLSHSSFGSSDCPAARKMRKTLELVNELAPELEIDGEMHGDAALVESIRHDLMPDSPLKGSANLLIMPNMEAARISYNLLRVSCSEGVTVGPVLMGVAAGAHPDADRLGAPHRQHGGAGGGGSPNRTAMSPVEDWPLRRWRRGLFISRGRGTNNHQICTCTGKENDYD